MKIFHISDLHLGMKFASYPPDIAESLREARFTALENSVIKANESQSDLLVVAGDLFDTIKIRKQDVLRTAGIIGQFEGLAAVLPGNHDYLDESGSALWDAFCSAMASNTMLLDEKKPYDLRLHGLEAVVFPGPCGSKHSATNVIGWIDAIADDYSDVLKIGIAHGSLTGISVDLDDRYFPMEASKLNAMGMDIWLLGHAHVKWPEQPDAGHRVFYASLTEADGFDCRTQGHAWLHEMTAEQRKSADVQVGVFSFNDLSFSVANDDALLTVVSDVKKLAAQTALVRVKLAGTVSRDALAGFAAELEAMSHEFRYLVFDRFGSQISETVSSDEIAGVFPVGSFPRLLLDELLAADDEAAARAVWDTIAEVKKC